MKNIIFIVTCTNDNYIGTLISSIIENNNILSVLIVVVNQCSFDVSIFNPSDSNNIIEIKTSHLPLSVARNRAIKYLLHNNISADFVMFPDDDSTFDKCFFTNFKKTTEPGKCYLIDVFQANSNKLYRQISCSVDIPLSENHFADAMSVNMVIDYSTLISVGFFDENLGVGSLYGAGEDGDYYIRCSKINSFYYNPILYNFHPASSSKHSKMNIHHLVLKYVSYGNGVIFMLCKHKKYKAAFSICLKAIGGLFYAIMRLDFKLAIAYFTTIFTRHFLFFKCLFYPKCCM